MKKTMKRPKAIQKPIVPILSNPKQKITMQYLIVQVSNTGSDVTVSS